MQSKEPHGEDQQHKRCICFYCNQAYLSDIERVQHIAAEHRGKIHYPTPEDFEKHLL